MPVCWFGKSTEARPLMQTVYRRRVQFADTDAAGVVHFSRLLCYAEEAEHALLDECGIAILGDGGWPRVSVSCDYLAPVRMGDTVEVTISVEELGRSSVSWLFLMSKGEEAVARGSMKTVRVDATGRAVELPDEWRELLRTGSGQ